MEYIDCVTKHMCLTNRLPDQQIKDPAVQQTKKIACVTGTPVSYDILKHSQYQRPKINLKLPLIIWWSIYFQFSLLFLLLLQVLLSIKEKKTCMVLTIFWLYFDSTFIWGQPRTTTSSPVPEAGADLQEVGKHENLNSWKNKCNPRTYRPKSGLGLAG